MFLLGDDKPVPEPTELKWDILLCKGVFKKFYLRGVFATNIVDESWIYFSNTMASLGSGSIRSVAIGALMG